MRCCGITSVEIIEMNPMDDLNTVHWVALEKASDDMTVSVYTCCDDEWGYKFKLENNFDYDRIKYNIMEMMFECETMKELLDELGDLFENGFGEMIVSE